MMSVEMEVAPFRALTRLTFNQSFAWSSLSRNGGRPIQGIDTKKRNYISVLFVIVEMEVAPFRPLTQCYNCNNQRDVDSGRNEARPTQGIVTEAEQTRELSF